MSAIEQLLKASKAAVSALRSTGLKWPGINNSIVALHEAIKRVEAERDDEFVDEDALSIAYMMGVEHGKRLATPPKPATKVNTAENIAVDHSYFFQPMSTCPLGVKVQLLNPGNVAVYGTVSARTIGDWRGWAPMPKIPEAMK